MEAKELSTATKADLYGELCRLNGKAHRSEADLGSFLNTVGPDEMEKAKDNMNNNTWEMLCRLAVSDELFDVFIERLEICDFTEAQVQELFFLLSDMAMNNYTKKRNGPSNEDSKQRNAGPKKTAPKKTKANKK